MKHECVEGVGVERKPGGTVRLTIDEATVTLEPQVAMEVAFEMLGWTLTRNDYWDGRTKNAQSKDGVVKQ